MQTRRSISVSPETLARFDRVVRPGNRSSILAELMDEYVKLCKNTEPGRKPPPPILKTWVEIEGKSAQLPQFFPTIPAHQVKTRRGEVATIGGLGKIRGVK